MFTILFQLPLAHPSKTYLSLWLSRVDAFLLGKKGCPYVFFFFFRKLHVTTEMYAYLI